MNTLFIILLLASGFSLEHDNIHSMAIQHNDKVEVKWELEDLSQIVSFRLVRLYENGSSEEIMDIQASKSNRYMLIDKDNKKSVVAYCLYTTYKDKSVQKNLMYP